MTGVLVGWVALACAILACAGLTVLALRLRAVTRRELAREARLQDLQANVQAVSEHARRLEHAQAALQQAVTQLRARQERVETRAPESRPYAHAIKLVKNGAGQSDIMAVCGLARAEAELILAIHGRHASENTRSAR